MKYSWHNVFPKEKKYKRGGNCCGECRASKHTRCRPKLDGTLCSCSCPMAVELRAEYSAQSASAQLHGLPRPSVQDAVKFIRPGFVAEQKL